MMKEKTQMIKILEILDREGPLSNKKISEITGIPYGTVRCYTSILNQNGRIRRYKDMRGFFELTEEGRKFLTSKKEG